MSLPTVSPPLKIDILPESDKKKGSYIVLLKDGVGVPDYVSNMMAQWAHSEVNITSQHDPSIFNGFSGELSDSCVEKLCHDNENVAAIEEDAIRKICVQQADAPWGLSRISQEGKLAEGIVDKDYRYTYDLEDPLQPAPGPVVHIYIIDTGIYLDHPDFLHRARWGGTFVTGYEDADGHGHGTHSAGTAAGTRYGVSKFARLVAVKVLDDYGYGWTSDIIKGLEFVVKDDQPSLYDAKVASMSLTGPPSDILDKAVEAMVGMGIHVAVAAGNSSDDAGLYSPSRVKVANTVASSDINDSKADTSCYGSVVNFFAPGVGIRSASNKGLGERRMSGTSMATPHVAGLAAYLIMKNGDMPPSELTSLMTKMAIKDALSNVPVGTANLLINNGNKIN